MRVPALIALAGLALGTAGCASMMPAPAANTPTVVAAAPQPVEGYDWFYHEDGPEARLAYGLETSDDLRLGLDCARAGGELTLSAIGPKGAAAEILVEAGGETERFAAQSEPSELHDGVFLTAQADAGTAVFQRFRQVGWLAVWQGETREAYAPHPGSRENIEKFFIFCG